MADCKKSVKKKEVPPKGTVIKEDPNAFYKKTPAWKFYKCDNDCWSLTSETAKVDFWNEILPFFKNQENRTWQDILITDNNKNHEIIVSKLNKCARDRLLDLRIEAESIISLRLQGKHRIYGYMEQSAFCILWYDIDHGDNNTCVCRSYQRHT